MPTVTAPDGAGEMAAGRVKGWTVAQGLGTTTESTKVAGDAVVVAAMAGAIVVGRGMATGAVQDDDSGYGGGSGCGDGTGYGNGGCFGHRTDMCGGLGAGKGEGSGSVSGYGDGTGQGEGYGYGIGVGWSNGYGIGAGYGEDPGSDGEGGGYGWGSITSDDRYGGDTTGCGWGDGSGRG